jgi:hypothetical protein
LIKLNGKNLRKKLDETVTFEDQGEEKKEKEKEKSQNRL